MMSGGSVPRSITRAAEIEDVIRELEIPRFSQEELCSFTSNFTCKIGSGGFGNVFKGMFNNVEIAVKVLNENGLDTEDTFISEVSTLGRTDHPNLVKLYGFCFSEKMKAIVYEYLISGSLGDFLYESNSDIRWEKLYDIAVGTAEGLSYLHEGDVQIIHHDIKARNVLLDSDFCPKIGDFGLAKLMTRDVTHFTSTRIRGTRGYAAPEIWQPTSKVTCKCDVYSFGMMLFEVLRRKGNHHNPDKWFPKQVWKKYKNNQFEELIMEDCGITEENREKAEILCVVGLWCIQFKSQARPSMKEVVKMLKAEVPVDKKPPDPFFPIPKKKPAPTVDEGPIIESIILAATHEILHEQISPEINVVSIYQEFTLNSPSTPPPLGGSIPDGLEGNCEQSVIDGIGGIQFNGLNGDHREGEAINESQISRNQRAENILSRQCLGEIFQMIWDKIANKLRELSGT